uniref:FecR family protein n=1 Tax=uncultured Draconibacterium sp. TaxID=1573823 RepID=UPI003217375C
MKKTQLQNYFYNRCSSQQAKEVEQWLAGIEEGDSNDLLLREILAEIEVEKNDDLVNRAFDKFVSKIQSTEKQKYADRSLVRKLGWLYRAAAALLFIPILLAAIFFYSEKNTPVAWVEEYVPYGESKMIYLPDSSKIWLNAGTKLIYPREFNHSIRQVYVAGEAFAEITKDKRRPFIMSAGEVSVEVLGTKFNVKSYSEDSYVAVSLLEGAVKLNTHFEDKTESAVLKPGESVRFSKSTGELTTSEFIAGDINLWHTNKGFFFIDEPLSEIVLSLERYFDVRINIENEALNQERYYSIFVNNESLDDILSALNVNGKMKIRRNSNSVYIY